jgi:hypothetical protein
MFSGLKDSFVGKSASSVASTASTSVVGGTKVVGNTVGSGAKVVGSSVGSGAKVVGGAVKGKAQDVSLLAGKFVFISRCRSLLGVLLAKFD